MHNPRNVILVVEASSIFIYVALWQVQDSYWNTIDERLVRIGPTPHILRGDKELSKQITKDNWMYPIIKDLLQCNQLIQTNYIILGEGPGSFTTLRVSHAFIRTLAMLWQAQIIPMASLSFWHKAFQLTPQDMLIVCIHTNMYYGWLPSKTDPFLAYNHTYWLNYLKDSPNKSFVWLYTTIKQTLVQNLSWPYSSFLQIEDIQDFSLPVDHEMLENISIPWEKALPKYGHSSYVKCA